MTDRPYNPPAFPCDYEIGREVEYDERLGQNVIRQLLEKRPGMDLRDYLAGLALEGCVEKQFSDALLARLGSTEATSAAIAGAAYQIADACLLARRGGVDPLLAAIEQRDALLDACEEALAEIEPRRVVEASAEDIMTPRLRHLGSLTTKLRNAIALARRPS